MAYFHPNRTIVQHIELKPHLQHIRYRKPKPFSFTLAARLAPHASPLRINAYNLYIARKHNNFIHKFSKIKNNAIHNLSSFALTTTEKVVLSLGPKFLPVEKVNKDKLKITYEEVINKLDRKLKISMYFTDSIYTPPRIPINNHATPWKPPPQPHDWIINKYIAEVRNKLHSQLKTSTFIYTDSDYIMHNTLKSLKNNNAIVIKPADKNLGITVLDKIDYSNMCIKHLSDKKTYLLIHNYTPSHGFSHLSDILKKHNRYREKLYNTDKITKLAASLLQLEHNTLLRIPPFYCLPKIHKTLIPPIPGRPIASSINSLTYYTSVYLDMQLQPTLKLLNTVCTSVNTLIADMTDLHPRLNSVLLCADVTSLYPNIPITTGTYTVYTVLASLNYFRHDHLLFLMDLLHWVLSYNYCTFEDKTYLQIEGTAMGTPVATSYANIFLYGIEHKLLTKYKPTYYKRYIDDIFAIYDDKIKAKLFINAFNNVIDSITLEAVTIGRSGIMLDLTLQLEHNIDNEHDYITHKLYQKPANIYQYIPYMSNHKSSIFKNFILQELCRFRLNCTNDEDYITAQKTFIINLLARGYNLDNINSIINDIPLREVLLEKIKLRLQQPKQLKHNMLIVTLQQPITLKPIKWSSIFNIPQYLKEHHRFHDTFKKQNIIIGSKNPPSIGAYIIKSNTSTL